MEEYRSRWVAKSLVPEKDSLSALRADYEERLNGLYGDIGRLTTQLTWLKKNLELNLSRDERLRLIERDSQELSVRTQVELLSVNRSGVYYQPQVPSEAEIQLKHRIDEIYTRMAVLWITKDYGSTPIGRN